MAALLPHRTWHDPQRKHHTQEGSTVSQMMRSLTRSRLEDSPSTPPLTHTALPRRRAGLPVQVHGCIKVSLHSATKPPLLPFLLLLFLLLLVAPPPLEGGPLQWLDSSSVSRQEGCWWRVHGARGKRMGGGETEGGARESAHWKVHRMQHKARKSLDTTRLRTASLLHCCVSGIRALQYYPPESSRHPDMQALGVFPLEPSTAQHSMAAHLSSSPLPLAPQSSCRFPLGPMACLPYLLPPLRPSLPCPP